MEVHQHTHTPRKKWNHYFWEFLMLFLAVFCGFLAENQREHLVEHRREKQFIRSFVEDLKYDTAAIQFQLNGRIVKNKRMDSLLILLKEKKIKGYENDLYFLGMSSINTWVFQNNDRTITQLKNSGGLRLIRNRLASDSIMLYDKLVEFVRIQQERETAEIKSLYPLLSSIFKPYEINKMMYSGFVVKRPVDMPALRSYDENLQSDLAFNIQMVQLSSDRVIWALQMLKGKATSIMAYLEKEYHLEL